MQAGAAALAEGIGLRIGPLAGFFLLQQQHEPRAREQSEVRFAIRIQIRGGEHFGVFGSRIEREVLFQRPATFAIL
ncbi:MAG: hypothetical protein ACK55I_19540, partial [bacterium]